MASTRVRIGKIVAGLVAIAGIGIVAGANGYLRGPAPATTPDGVTIEAVCGWQGATTVLFTLTPLTSRTGDLAIPGGAAIRYRVELTNNTSRDLRIPASSAPVLVATTVGDDPAVVGYAFLDHSPSALTSAPREVHEYSSFDAFRACPGGPTAPDGEHLATGSYDLFAGQALGGVTKPDGAPFTTWARMAELRLTEPRAPRSELDDGEVAVGPLGACGSPIHNLSWGSGAHASFDDLEPVLAVVGEPFDPRIHMTNHGDRDLDDVLLGGPLLLVSDRDGVILARTESVDPLPGPPLGPGEQLTFGRFGALVSCATGEPLEPGHYIFAVTQTARGTTTPTGVATGFGELVLTAEPDATREASLLPELPACGTSIDSFSFDPSLDRAAVTRAGYDGGDGEHPHLHDPDEGWPEIGIEYTYTGPERDAMPWGGGVALVRDGMVVARAVMLYDAFGEVPFATGSTHDDSLITGWDCTVGEEHYAGYLPSGEYTALGYVASEYQDEWGLPAYVVAVLDPVTVDFGTAPSTSS